MLIAATPTVADKEAPRFLSMRSDCVLIELMNLDATLALYDAIASAKPVGVLDVVPAAQTVMVSFDPMLTSVEELKTSITSLAGNRGPAPEGAHLEIPVRYDGEDLSTVAAMLALSVEEVVRLHTQSDYLVAFTGFAPGFAYLANGDPRLCVARRTSPRTHVPAGSVGLAGTFSGIYPKTSPGGWQLIGTTPLAMFDMERDPPSLLQPGQRIRFRDISGDAACCIQTHSSPPTFSRRVAAEPASTRASIEILSIGFPVLFQDLGRPGLTEQGISRSGAADRANLKAVNRLVGNAREAAALEIAFGGFSFRMRGSGVMAVTGATTPISVRNAKGAELQAPHHQAFALEDGDVVTIGAAQAGLRAYLSLRGGFDVAPVLGSRATDTLAQIGPEPLKQGDVIAVMDAPTGELVAVDEIPAFSMPRADQTLWIDVVLGPRDDWFTPESVERFLAGEWTVSNQSSRIGIRLEGKALERRISAELPSEATVHGAIQVPANGQPLLFLADHPLTGGYPVIANVARHHLDLVGQAPVGTRIRFRSNAMNASRLTSGKPI